MGTHFSQTLVHLKPRLNLPQPPLNLPEPPLNLPEPPSISQNHIRLEGGRGRRAGGPVGRAPHRDGDRRPAPGARPPRAADPPRQRVPQPLVLAPPAPEVGPGFGGVAFHREPDGAELVHGRREL